jgi:hypothetical protein
LPASRGRELAHPPPDPVPEPGARRHATPFDPPNQLGGPAERLLKQVSIGREVDVGFDHGGVDPQLAAA